MLLLLDYHLILKFRAKKKKNKGNELKDEMKTTINREKRNDKIDKIGIHWNV
jgi:hypothetical protein